MARCWEGGAVNREGAPGEPVSAGHRLATIQSCEVFNRGRVVASGSHVELAAEEGLCVRLCRLQLLA